MQLRSCGNDGGGDRPIRGKTMLIDAPPAKRGRCAPGPRQERLGRWSRVYGSGNVYPLSLGCA